MIRWSDNYIMGIPELDEGHRQAFEIAGQILHMTHAHTGGEGAHTLAIRERLEYLVRCISQHSAREEAYMREICYEGYVLHKMLHEDFQGMQIAKYRQIVERGVYSKDEIWDFIGSGMGWLLAHMATADMEIVGRGVLNRPAVQGLDLTAVEGELNRLFRATLDMEAEAVVLNPSYGGEPLGDMVCQKIVYRRGWRVSTVICGIERSFLLQTARRFYGTALGDERGLIFSTAEMFIAQFWIALNRQLTGVDDIIDVCENRFLLEESLPEELGKLEPTLSLLFTSNQGKLFVATNSPRVGAGMKLA